MSTIEILAENLFDPQLALVVSRLKEEEKSDLDKKVVYDYFLLNELKEKDPCIVSISHYLLGDYCESVRCLDYIPDP